MSGYTGRNRPVTNGGPNGVQRLYASQLKEHESLFNSYEHLQGLPRGDAALTMLRKVASLCKPIMRKRGWRVQILAEFLPPEQNLLGLNVNRGYKICIRLRYHNNPDLFLPLEQVVDTMLHELSHNVWGAHDSNFHRLWDELRDEHETLVCKGYTGEGFLSEGHKLGGGRHGVPPPHEMRRLARASAEKRKAQGTLTKGSGQRLGGTPLHLYGGDARQIIADQVTRRNTINNGCASGRKDATKLSNQAANNTFSTKAEEDDANDRAIAQALYELMEEEEARKLQDTFSAAPPGGGLAWSPRTGLYDPSKRNKPPMSDGPNGQSSEEEQLKWAMNNSTQDIVSAVSDRPGPYRFSPVSPEDQAEIARTASTPRVPLNTKPKLVEEIQPLGVNSKKVSRTIKDPHEEAAADRERPYNHRRILLSGSRKPLPKQPQSPVEPIIDLSEPHNPEQWACEICTCINPLQFLACDACGSERQQSASASVASSKITTAVPRWTTPKAAQHESLGWKCERCGAFMEHRWWICSSCGLMKSSS